MGTSALNAFRQIYTADFGTGKLLNIGTNGFNVYSEHAVTLKNGIKLQVSGLYNKGGVWGGTFVNKGMATWILGFKNQSGIEKRMSKFPLRYF
jgi:hypothetical protein